MWIKVDAGKSFSTHEWVLLKILEISTGTVVELGAGIHSTALLHWVCKGMNRKLVTYESDYIFHKLARNYISPLHKLVKVEDWEKDLVIKDKVGVLFIDHHLYGRLHDETIGRARDALRFKDMADYIIIHDSDKTEFYGFTDEFWSNFKYRYDWIACRPYTTVVSNFKDLKSLEIII